MGQLGNDKQFSMVCMLRRREEGNQAKDFHASDHTELPGSCEGVSTVT